MSAEEKPDFNDNAFYKIARVYKKISGIEKNISLDQGFRSVIPDVDADDGKLMILSWFDDAIQLISLQQIGEERISEGIDTVVKFKKSFLNACSRTNVSDFLNVSQANMAVRVLNPMGDSIAGAKIDGLPPLDRKLLLSKTADLAEIVKSFPMDEYARGVLLLKLSAFSRVVNDCGFYSDNEIRGRVKAIYADFSAEFRKHDKKYETLAEAMFNWAKACGSHGYLALGLYATCVSVGLLPPVPTVLAIAGPAAQ